LKTWLEVYEILAWEFILFPNGGDCGRKDPFQGTERNDYEVMLLRAISLRRTDIIHNVITGTE
jgi:hypothetical protein